MSDIRIDAVTATRVGRGLSDSGEDNVVAVIESTSYTLDVVGGVRAAGSNQNVLILTGSNENRSTNAAGEIVAGIATVNNDITDVDDTTLSGNDYSFMS
jgi:hypothetical protein